jgi:hypothetical protein
MSPDDHSSHAEEGSMGFVELVVAALAVWEILEIWHHSSIMASWRARAELLEGKLGELLGCMFCMSPWTSAFVLLFLGWWDWPGRPVTAFVVWVFAVARLANLGNDLGYPLCRTYRHNREIPDVPQDVPSPETGEAAGPAAPKNQI